jgi:hypothetical protein
MTMSVDVAADGESPPYAEHIFDIASKRGRGVICYTVYANAIEPKLPCIAPDLGGAGLPLRPW